MKPSLRDPLDGWWSHEHRAWMRAVDRGVDGEELEELDRAAIAAGARLRERGLALLVEDLQGRAFVAARTPPELELPPAGPAGSASASTSSVLHDR